MLHEDADVIASATSPPRPDPHPRVPREHIRPLRDLTGPTPRCSARLFATIADLARSEGIADAGYRLVANVGRVGRPDVDHLHIHLLGGRPSAGLPDEDRAALVVLCLLVSACGGTTTTARPTGAAPSGGATSTATESTRADLQRVLGAARLQLTDPQVPYRPAEAPQLAGAPRSVVQVVLPSDPTHGYIVIYDLGDDVTARTAGDAQAAYVASGPGRIEFPSDAEFVIRQVGSTLVFYAWSPGGSTDELALEIQPVLETIGSEIVVPR